MSARRSSAGGPSRAPRGRTVRTAAPARRVRVVQLIPSLPVGGAERMMASLAAGLDRDRWDVKVVSFHDPMHNAIDAALAAAGIELVSLGKGVGFDPRTFARVDAALRRLAPDLVHTHRPVFPYALPTLAARFRGRVVHTVHNLAAREVAGRARRATHWLAFRAGVAPVAICGVVARSLVEVHGVAPRATIPNGIPVDAYRAAPGTRARWRAANGIPADAVVLAFTGRLAEQKDPLALLDVLATLGGAAMAVVAGDGPLRPELARRARALGCEPRLRLLGVRDDVPAMLAASDAFVLPSRWEGHPLVVMEAMAAGLPVVATAVGGVPELVRSGRDGLLVPAGDRAALARAVAELVGSPELRRRMAAEARRRAVREFDLPIMVAAYERLYQELLSARGVAVEPVRPRRRAAR